MSKKYAFLLMGKDFNPQRDHACFSAGGVDSYIITVRSPEEAVKKADRCRVHMPDHFESVIRFREHKLAYSKSFYPGARLEDGKNVCFDSDDWYEMLRFYHFVLSDG